MDGALGFERGDRLLEHVAARAELGDAALGQRDDGVAGVVVLFEAQRLAVEGALEVGLLVVQAGELGVVLAPFVGDRVAELVAQQAQALGPEEAAAEEVEQLVEDEVLFDLQGAGVAGDVGGDGPAVGVEAAAVVVGVLLVGAFHAPPAQGAAHAAAEDVEAAGAPVAALGVLGRGLVGAVLVPARALLDELEELPGDQRRVHQSRAPDPLLAGAQQRAARALVVAAPHVVARVLGVAQQRPQL